VSVQGKPITGPGSDRGMVFQDYALFSLDDGTPEYRLWPAAAAIARAEIDSIADEFVKSSGSSVSPTAIRQLSAA